MNFVTSLEKAREETGSTVCVGLDLASYGTRPNFTLAENQDKQKRMIELIEELSDSCCCYKINRQYILDLTLEEIKELTAFTHKLNRPVIIDHKITDIGSTNAQAINHFYLEGFDAFTASPFAGNTKEICEAGHRYGLSSFILVLMSNPEAEWMKRASLDGKPIYQFNAQESSKYADGIVVGSTGHVTLDELRVIKNELSEDKLVLAPGIGTQGGEVKSLLNIFNSNVIFNIGRAIIYSKNPRKELVKYNKLIDKSGQ